ncbi:hypothetical protein EON63_01050 [archaeon]|nr:MAG: hypothetical protein EON63_01050 [archaeon]
MYAKHASSAHTMHIHKYTIHHTPYIIHHTCSSGSCSSDNDHSLILTLQLIDSSYSSNYLESHFESLGNLSPSPCAGCSYITYTPSSSLDAADRYVLLS